MARQYKPSPDARKINLDLLSTTYGVFVNRLVQDKNMDLEAVNATLFEIGQNIGVRIVEDFVARSNIGRCVDFSETADIISKVAFKAYLGIIPAVTDWSSNFDSFTLSFDSNPLSEYVELSDKYKDLWFSNVLCGVIKGSLEMLKVEVNVAFISDKLRGDKTTEIRVSFVKKIGESAPSDEY